MKKKILMLLASLSLLTGCGQTSEEYIPSQGGKVEPEAPKKDADVTDENFNDDAVTLYEFYFSYSYSDEPLYSVEGPTFSPLGNDKVPDYLKKQETLVTEGSKKGYVVDPAFPIFIGWSACSSCPDEDGLWDFSNDHAQLGVIPLYGIWVNE